MKNEMILGFTLFENESEIEMPQDRDREVKYEKKSREFSRNETLAGYCKTPNTSYNMPRNLKKKNRNCLCPNHLYLAPSEIQPTSQNEQSETEQMCQLSDSTDHLFLIRICSF